MKWRTILVEVWFFAKGRRPPPFGDTYRPHFVVKGTTDYLGIQFEHLEQKPFGEHILTIAQLSYEKLGVDYSKLQPKTEFEIKEGGTTVGEGFVVEI